MDRIKLINHVKQGDTFYTPYTNPKGMGAALSISSWSRSWLPEFLWIGLILKKIGRKNGLEKLYKIIRKLQDNKICVPQFSEIAKVDTEKQKLYWEIVSHYIDKSVLAPLTVIITPDVNEVFYNLFFDFNENIDEKISDMFVVIKECNTFHDELTTDICFVVDWFYALNGRLNILSELSSLPEALTKYYKYNHEDEAMRLYRPIIRSLFQGLCNNDNDCKNFSSLIWTRLGEISECNPLILVWEGNEDMTFYEKVTKVMDYISSTNEDKKMETKYAVVMGMTCYIYKIYKEIIEKHLQNDISGRILFRTMVESYINLKYIILQEVEVPDIYDRFKAYGLGKYKLVMAKMREGKYSISEEAQMMRMFMELLVNEEMDEAFVNMSIGFFDKTNINKKFTYCDEQLLYEIYYEYGTNFAHGFWGAIRESSMLICDNPTHNYHTVPDFQAEQNLHSVHADCEMLMKKVFKVISGYIEIPEFYSID